MELFSASYFLNTRWNRGITVRMTQNRPRPRMGVTSKKISAMRPPITKAMVNENTSISGQRMAARTIIM